MPPDFFRSYLKSVCQHYAQWERVYTLTDVVGQTSIQRSPTLPMWDLGLKVQVINHDKDSKNNESKIERFTVLEGIRRYAADHVLLVGQPGSGKSTALVRLLIEEAQKAQQDSSALIPVLVELRYYQNSVLELMRSFFKTHGLLLDRPTIETLLFERRFLLLVDGLNELPSEEARSHLSALRRDYRKVPMIFTTRDLSIGGDLGIEKKLEMQPLSELQMQAFVRAYIPEQSEAMLRQLNDRLRDFGKTPLLLWMLCEVIQQTPDARLPSNLAKIFQVFIDAYQNSSIRNHEVACLKGNVQPLSDRRLWKKALQCLASAMMQGKTPVDFRVVISRDEAGRELEKLFQNERFPVRDLLDDLIKYHLLQNKSAEQIEFRHQLIQEYYVAEQLLKQLPQLNDECLKWNYLNYLKWTEPIALMLELVEDEQEALRVVRLALEVDWQLGARLAGKVKLEWQGKTIEMVRSLQLSEIFEVRLLGITQSEKVIPLLNEFIIEDFYVCQEVTDALSKINSEATIPLLDELIKNGIFNVSRSAASALGKIGSEAALLILIELLLSDDDFTWMDAVDALGEIGETAIPLIAKILEDEDDSLHFKAVTVLDRVGEASIPLLTQLLKRKDFFNRDSVTKSLARLSGEAAIPLLVELLQDKQSEVRRSAVEALGEIGSESTVPLLVGLLNHKRSDVCVSAVEALGEISSKAAIPLLGELLEDKESRVRWSVACALGKIGSEAAIPLLSQLLRNEDCDVREVTIYSLGKIDSGAAVLLLVELLDNVNPSVRLSAAYSLSKLGKATIPLLIELLNDKKPFFRESAIDSLGRMNSEAAILLLVELLKDKDHFIYSSSIEALSNIGKAAIPQLVELLKDKDADVRGRGAEALGRIGEETAIPLLVQILSDENSSVRQSIAYALGAIGVEAVIPLLHKLLEDENPNVRSSAAYALITTHPEALTSMMLYRLLEDEDFGVRVTTVDTLSTSGVASAIFQLKQHLKDEEFINEQNSEFDETIAALTAIQNRCKRYNAEPAISTEKPIAPTQSKTSDQKSEQAIVPNIFNFYAPVYGVAGNVEGDLNVHPSESNSDTTDL